MSIVYLNGQFLPIEKAQISVMDRGFLFGDGVYEVIPVYQRKAFELSRHLARLAKSLAAIRLENPHQSSEWQKLIEQTIEQNEGDEQLLYIQVTRGADVHRNHSFPETIQPTIFIKTRAFAAPSYEALAKGFAAVTLNDPRWQYCHIKAITLLPNVLLRQSAIDQAVDETILIRDGVAIEGASSNLFIVKSGRIITPPTNGYILGGITRERVIEIAKQLELPLVEQSITVDELKNADEVWLTASSKMIMPVLHLDSNTVGDGTPGPLWNTVIRQFMQCKEA